MVALKTEIVAGGAAGSRQATLDSGRNGADALRSRTGITAAGRTATGAVDQSVMRAICVRK